MNLGQDKWVNLLAWPDIEPSQQAKVPKLLHHLRADIAVRLKWTV